MVKKDVGYLIKTINDKLKVKADESLKQYNLTLTQSRVLTFLNSKNGQALQKEIELFLEVSHPTVVGIVSRMEQKGYITSWLDERDKRNKIVKVTEQAQDLAVAMEQQMSNNEKTLLASLSREDVEQLKDLLFIIYKNIE